MLLARALVTDPDILLADEPVAALDPAHQFDVMQLLYEGATLADGEIDEVLSDDNLTAAYAIELVEPEEVGYPPFVSPWRRLPG